MMSSHSDIYNQLLPLTQAELDELDLFLISENTSDETMMLDALDGYLTAIVVGPNTLDFGQWFKGIWGPNPKDIPNFKSMEEAQRIIDLVARLMNGIAWGLEGNMDTFSSIVDVAEFRNRNNADVETWAFGFISGINVCRKDWQPFFDDPKGAEMLRPIYLLGSDDILSEEIALIGSPGQREELSKLIPSSVASIYRFWLPYHQAVMERMVATALEREMPGIDHNESCPCGSEKHFKRCCGVAAILH